MLCKNTQDCKNIKDCKNTKDCKIMSRIVENVKIAIYNIYLKPSYFHFTILTESVTTNLYHWTEK